MGRYRPPAEKSSPYITRDGFNTLQQELNAIWKRRAGVTRALSAAAAEGDRSENAEYIYRKKELRELDRRLRYLQRRLPTLKIVDKVSDTARVFFGARVTLEDGDGVERVYRIVGADELQHEPGGISVDSPLARALLGKAVDDGVSVESPQGEQDYVILAVAYD